MKPKFQKFVKPDFTPVVRNVAYGDTIATVGLAVRASVVGLISIDGAGMVSEDVSNPATTPMWHILLPRGRRRAHCNIATDGKKWIILHGQPAKHVVRGGWKRGYAGECAPFATYNGANTIPLTTIDQAACKAVIEIAADKIAAGESL